MRFNPDEYITVAERVAAFYERFPQGRILTSIVQHNEETGFVLIRAEAYREPDDALPAATGHAYELKSAGHVQAGSYVEVCETSSVGRALALLGFEVKRGVASREEVQRGARKAEAGRAPVRVASTGNVDADIMTALQILGKTEEGLNEYARKNYDLGPKGDWTDLSPTDKDDLLAVLNRQVDKVVAQAK